MLLEVLLARGGCIDVLVYVLGDRAWYGKLTEPIEILAHRLPSFEACDSLDCGHLEALVFEARDDGADQASLNLDSGLILNEMCIR